MKVLFSFDIKDKYIESLRNTFEDVELIKSEDMDVLNEEIKDADVFAAMLLRKFDSDLIKKGEKLQWIQSWSAGVDQFLKADLFGYLKENNIMLTSVRGIHRDSMAEQVMGYLISFSRRLPELMKLQEKRVWDRLKVDYLKDKTVAIFGLGAVGKEVARKANVFKMNVIGIKRHTDVNIPYVNKIYSPDETNKVLNKSDFVVVTLPLTDETAGYFGMDQFKEMQETAYFINVSRGKIVKEEDLIEALKKEEIKGAALDVFQEEPLPEDSPLYELDNVIITPHTSGLFPDYNREAVKIFKNNLRYFLEDEEMVNVVDLDLQY